MPPSHVRKEEAELRQIAKQSRLARKTAQQRERKQRQRVQRAAVKSGEAAVSAAEPAGTSALKIKRGAIVLPDEVQELRQRLMSDDPTRSASAAGSPERNKTKAGAKKTARSLAKKAAGADWVSSHSTASSSSALVPAYHEEVHFKKKMFCVDVVLHHVPHQKIDISETNTHQLVVDTCGHTKKYRLVLPYPGGMRCDATAATYEFENGILQCRLPIVDGAIPADLEAENEKMIEKMRQQRALRFRVTQDGDLKVRTRRALLAPTPAAHAVLLAAKEAAAKRGNDTDSESDAINAGVQVTGKAEKTVHLKSRKRDRDGGEEDDKGTPQQLRCASAKRAKGAATAAETAAPQESATKKSKPDIFEAEHVQAMEAARAAAAQVRLSMRERVKLAKKVQANREERLKTRTLRRERKEEQKQQSFHRVLEEQKRQLLARASMQQPVLCPAPKANASAKSVHFADA